jgi:penicillin-binding protein 2
MSPQLARRVAILGGTAFILFAALFFRLWFLEVLSGEDYVSQAAQNRVRKVKIEAPRGDIVDRNGKTLVKTRQAAVVQVLPGELPEAEKALAASYGAKVSAAERDRLAAKARLRDLRQRDAAKSRKKQRQRLTPAQRRERRQLKRASRQARAVPIPPMPQDAKVQRLFGRLGRTLDVQPRTIHRRIIEQVAQTPYAAVTIKTDIPKAAFTYLLERQSELPAVKPEIQFLRSYPYGSIGSHLFGTLREISPDELEQKKYKEVDEGERIGKDGVEESYDRYLRGQDGYYRQVVDALGQSCDDPGRCAVRRVKPRQGQQLQLTLDLRLQKAATEALESIGAGRPGAFVAMDPRNGEVLAMGSYPSFDANLFAKPISQEKYNELNSEEAGTPLINRAIDGLYPTGSTFKLITATAALQDGLIGPADIVDDPGSVTYGTTEFKNAGDAVNGAINIVQALTVSSDVFFYKLGYRMNGLPNQVLQTWARRLGLGHSTGIDLPGEFGGLVPDAEWRNKGFAEYQACTERKHVPAGTEAALFACGGIERPWAPGDNVNLSVGQGDLQATPLQMAVAYAAIENGGTIVRPHLGREVQDGQGRLVQKLRSPVRRKLDISQTTLDTIRQGLRAAASPGGTSGDVFKDVDLEVYGKTGTAERGTQEDQSWYLAFVPDESRPIVVAVTVERGGFGAETAAPAACRILTSWFDQSPARCHSGSSTTR